MSLLEEARQLPKKPGPKCDVQKALDSRPELSAEIIELIRADDVEHSVASRILEKRQIFVAQSTIGRHRANNCGHCKRMGVTW